MQASTPKKKEWSASQLLRLPSPFVQVTARSPSYLLTGDLVGG
jgi:hypothetical protein